MIKLNDTQLGVIALIILILSAYGIVLLLEEKECVTITVITKSRSYYENSIETELGTFYPNSDEMYNNMVIGKTYNITYVGNIWRKPPIVEVGEC